MTGLQRGSVVRMSVFDWRTFLALRLIYGWHVTSSWVLCPLWVNQPGQAFYPIGVGKWVVIHVITWFTGWRPLNARPELHVWLFVLKAASPCLRA